jgi:hypothetical protein
MPRSLQRALLATAAALFILALWHLFELRFSAGDVFPQGSSFRADPLGTRAFFEALSRTPGHTVARQVQPLRKFDTPRDTTLLFLSLSPESDTVSPGTMQVLDEFLSNGGRLILTYRGDAMSMEQLSNVKQLILGTNVSPRPSRPLASPNPRNGGTADGQSLSEHFGFSFTSGPVPAESSGDRVAYRVRRSETASTELPNYAHWHSPLSLILAPAVWNPLYQRGVAPVMSEWRFGSGTVIVATDAWFHSNEALRDDRSAPLLSWVAGRRTKLIFDETHLGIQMEPGIVSLARRYRLQGLGIGLLTLAALFIWRNSVPLLPRAAGESPFFEIDSEQSSIAGFAHLLQRSIPPSEMLVRTFEDWKRFIGPKLPDGPSRQRELQDLVNLELARPTSKHEWVSTWQKMAKLLKRD